MSKYRLLREAVQARAAELTGLRLSAAPAATDEELMRAHSAAYVEQVVQGTLPPARLREIGFPWSPAMVERSRRSVGATLAAARAALTEGVSLNLAGGTHHASEDHGAGFCVFNDVAVAARTLQAEHRRCQPDGRWQMAVIDLDVHQGNGTASIFAQDESVFTLSLHGAKNYPFQKVAGDLDVELPDGCEDAAYLRALDDALCQLWERTRHRPPELVFYLAGADPLAGDRLGRLSLSQRGLAERDRRVLAALGRRQIPVAVSMAGGYGRRIEDTVCAQVNTVRLAWAHWRRWTTMRASHSPVLPVP